LLVFCFVR